MDDDYKKYKKLYEEMKAENEKLKKIIGGRPRKFSEKQERQMVAMRQAGMVVREIAEAMKSNISTVQYILKRHGL